MTSSRVHERTAGAIVFALAAGYFGSIVAGVFSQGTGVFGGLMLLDASEATYCVPLNRASSILGGIVASAVLAVGFGLAWPSWGELVGASLLVGAIGVLWLGPRLRAHGS